ncbi:unnamed protein product, partial [Didymodactylos carnosus]
SEHRINGKKYAGEAHFVHQNPSTNQLAVLSFLIIESKHEDTEWRTYVDKAVTLNSTGYQTVYEGNLSALMYAHTDSYQDFWWYNGSLTTPPCSENVIWIIFHGGIEFSDNELQLLHKYVFFEDFREPQPLNNRIVLRSYPKEDDSMLTDQYYCCNKQQPQSSTSF